MVRIFLSAGSNFDRLIFKIERNEKIGHISPVEAKTKKIEILTALQKLNEKLKPEEELLLKSHYQEGLKQFKRVEDETIGLYLQ